MQLALAQIIVAAFEVYALAGMVFALLFLPRAIARMDPGIAPAPLTLRVLLMPGIVALWPLFAWRWATGARAPVERNPHREKARE